MRCIALRYALALVLVTLACAPFDRAHAQLRVAVMPFDNASGDAALDPLGTGLQAMLTTDLGAVSAFVLIERARLAAIQAELALATTAAIDPRTAAQVGKLAGASHLIAGAITVFATTMRLDARLFDVATGEVVLTAKIEGEKDAFFELEKQLVQKIIEATQAKVTPKERATVARIHTSDFGAFARFSAGVFAFDRQEYDKALAALREAAAMDEEFKLAKLTLDDYGVIIQKLEARAVLLDANQKKAKALAADAHAQEQQPLIDRLWKIAKAADGKTPEAKAERLAALYQLALIYGVDGTSPKDVAMRRFEDHWLMERTSDALCQAYHAEAVAAWPMVPVFVTADFSFQAPLEAKDYEVDQKQWLAHFFGKDGRRDRLNFHHDLLDDLNRDTYFTPRMHVDAAGHARLVERAYQLGMKLDLAGVEAKYQSRKGWWRHGMTSRLGSLFRAAGLLDESTKYFAESGRLAEEVYAVKGAATEVERNKATVAFLKAHPSPLVREWIMSRGFDVGSSDADYRERVVSALEGKPLGVVGRYALANARSFMRSGHFQYVIVNDVPVWPLASSRFVTGARSDPRRTTSFNYYRGASKTAETEPYVAMVGAQRSAWKTSFEVAYEPAADWWYEGFSSSAKDLVAAGYVAARPRVAFLFGVEDVDVPTTREGNSAPEKLQRGMRGFALVLEGDTATLAAVNEREVHNNLSLSRYQLDHKKLASAGGIGGAKVAVSLSVSGRKVTAKVGGKTLEATLPREAGGFSAFVFERAGYASIEKLAL